MCHICSTVDLLQPPGCQFKKWRQLEKSSVTPGHTKEIKIEASSFLKVFSGTNKTLLRMAMATGVFSWYTGMLGDL